MLRSKAMLAFFTPLLQRCAKVIVYYTNKTKLSELEIAALRKKAPLTIHQTRPNLKSLISDTIAKSANLTAPADKRASGRFGKMLTRAASRAAGTLRAMPAPASADTSHLSKEELSSWCALYCGGSHKIKDTLQGDARQLGIGWEAELFDW